MSSNEIMIRVENLGKCYHIYERSQDRLKQSIAPRIRRAFGWPATNYFREFWALKDVSFELRRGETVGIIGRNGSGKSTLLQLICGTLTSTTGNIWTTGRIAALLELGAGFNPEFTGRENVYLSGSVMGLTTRQIDERFDAITAFADIGDFIEQPVKTYSSGMYVRLAFAVIAHVDADVLVIDEALAVGDAIFIQKCMRFIRQFQKRGALLFVSHDTGTIVNLCQNAIWLNHGTVQGYGSAQDIAEAYLQYTHQELYGDTIHLEALQSNQDTASTDLGVVGPEPKSSTSSMIDDDVCASIFDNLPDATGWKTGAAEILSVRIEKTENGADAVFHGGELIRLVIQAVAHQPLDRPIIGFILRDRLGQALFAENTLSFTDVNPTHVASGQEIFGKFVFYLPMLPNGQYTISSVFANGSVENHIQHHWLHDALILTVSSNKRRYGLVGIPFEQVTLETSA
jgi:lipopolysaccharide transport system ATP-binding protein